MSEAPGPADDFRDLAAHRFEPEFDGPPPRDIPATLRVGPFARERRDTVVGLLTGGAVCLLLSQLPLTERWGEHVVPLAHLDWIGAALGAAGLAAWGYHQFSRGAFEYVRGGEPLAGRILGLELRPVMVDNGQPVLFGYAARVRFADPDSGLPYEREVKSPPLTLQAEARCEATYRVGDVATLVALPGKFDKTLTLYGFLGLRDELGITPKPDAPSRLAQAMLHAAVVMPFLAVLCWNMYAHNYYTPLHIDADQFAVGGVGAALGVAAIIALLYVDVWQRRATAAANVEAAAAGRPLKVVSKQGQFAERRRDRWAFVGVMLFGSALLGGLTAACWAWTLNACLDGGPAAERPAAVVGSKQTTAALIFRHYKVEYRFADDPDQTRHRYSTDPAGLGRLAGPRAVAEVMPGAFGWAWVRRLEPIEKP